MKKFCLIILLCLWGGSFSLQAQILSKIRTAAKKVAKEVSEEVISEIECAVFDQECIDKAKKEGKKVVLVEGKDPVDGTGKDTGAAKKEGVTDQSVSSPENLSDLYDTKSTVTVCKISNPVAQIFTSEDLSLMAIGGFMGSRKAYCVNGNMEDPYDLLGAFFISPDGKHYAYSAYKDDKCYLVFDGKVIDQTPGLGNFSGITWNDNGVMAYIKLLDKPSSKTKGKVVIKGEESPTFENVTRIPFFIRDETFYYAISSDGKTTLYANHKVIDDHIDGLHWNQSGDFVYKVNKGNIGEKLVINGKSMSGYNNISGYEFDPGTGAVIVHADGKKMISWNDQVFDLPENEHLQDIGESRFVANEASNRFIFMTKNDFYRVYDNGKGSSPYQYIENLQLSGNGKVLFYAAYNANKAFLVRNGEEIGPYQSIREISVSPTGNDYYYTAEALPGKVMHFHNGQNLNVPSIYDLFLAPDLSRYLLAAPKEYIIDGEKFEGKIDVRTPPVFSPDGKRLAYVLEESSGHRKLLLDGIAYQGEKPSTTFRSFNFSPDNKHFVFTQSSPGQESRLYIDMKPGPVFPFDPVLAFSSDNKLRALLKDRESITNFEISLK